MVVVACPAIIDGHPSMNAPARTLVATLSLAAVTPCAAAQDPAAGAGPRWELEVSIAAYVLPDASDYLQPTVIADRGALHLESRYHYEDDRTVSLFVGWNVGAAIADGPHLELTPMLGGTVGRTAGLAPALELTVTWGRFTLDSAAEYVIVLDEPSASFFYSWSEAAAQLTPWLRAGLVLQRTRVVHTPRELALGPWLGVSLGRVDVAFYLFDPFDEERFLVASLGRLL
jgi:hypothetical protein